MCLRDEFCEVGVPFALFRGIVVRRVQREGGGEGFGRVFGEVDVVHYTVTVSGITSLSRVKGGAYFCIQSIILSY